MPKRSLVWHLFPSYVLVALAAVAGVGWTALRLFESSYLHATRADLAARADFLIREFDLDASDNHADFAALADRFRKANGIRIAVVLPSGRVEFDSQRRPEELENQADHPEVRRALEEGTHDVVRYNAGLDQRLIDMAVPIDRGGTPYGVLFLSAPLGPLDQAIAQMQFWIPILGLAVLGLAIPLAWRAVHRIAEPLASLRQAATRLAAGEWATRATIPDPQELAELTEAFNAMADRLQRQVGVLIQNNNEQKAVLASMAEGVLAVDSQERVISCNEASSRLLSIDQAHAQGRPLREVVRNADLSRFVTRALASQEPIEADVLLHGDRERVMQARGSALHDLDGHAIGAVIVLNDVTDFRRLELIRRDFVANVSHELKTPVTSIKGFVETLLDGAMNDPGDTERFLRIIAKQADRLHAIIEDLLSLSKIEQTEDSDDLVLEPTALRGVIESALHTCQTAAQERQIEITLDCQDRLSARLNPLLFEQALVNLLDNAIKYSEPGRQVRVAAAESDGEVTVSIADHGCGIASEHQARIFERFYRVDRARSRKLGGTGLGLAIVKHIAQAHRGRITVDSTLGIGSTFTIHLPRP